MHALLFHQQINHDMSVEVSPFYIFNCRDAEILFSFLLLLLFNWEVVSDSLRPHKLQHARLPCPSLSPSICSNSCLLSQ